MTRPFGRHGSSGFPPRRTDEKIAEEVARGKERNVSSKRSEETGSKDHMGQGEREPLTGGRFLHSPYTTEDKVAKGKLTEEAYGKGNL